MLLLALATGAPGALASAVLLAHGGYSAKVQWTAGVFVVGIWLSTAFAVRAAVVRPLQTLSNLLAALREEDFSFRARGTRGDDALSLAMAEVNALADVLRHERLGALEATALLRKVMDEIDVAVFTLDRDARLRLVNRAGERVMARPAEQLLGRTADELGLAPALAPDAPPVLELAFAGESGRWQARRGVFRQGGLPHHLLVLANLNRALREEERQAWQRLIRVIGHELNNSLAPIKSIGASLESLLAREARPADWEQDVRRGLAVIASRAEALGRFTEAYGRLARLPSPRLGVTAVADLVKRAAGLDRRLTVHVTPGPAAVLQADADQLEQLLINLLRNAIDAALETGGGVRAGWSASAEDVEIWIEDDGPGLANTANLFVPFFTTKPQGSGIGLVLSRQIAEAHGGTLILENRRRASGCLARLRLPRRPPTV